MQSKFLGLLLTLIAVRDNRMDATSNSINAFPKSILEIAVQITNSAMKCWIWWKQMWLHFNIPLHLKEWTMIKISSLNTTEIHEYFNI